MSYDTFRMILSIVFVILSVSDIGYIYLSQNKFILDRNEINRM